MRRDRSRDRCHSSLSAPSGGRDSVPALSLPRPGWRRWRGPALRRPPLPATRVGRHGAGGGAGSGPEGGDQAGSLPGDGDGEDPGSSFGQEALQPAGVLVDPNGADLGEGDVAAIAAAARAAIVSRTRPAPPGDPRSDLNTGMPLFFTLCSQTASLGSLMSGSAVDIAPIGGKF
jgi:hypothetical protein